MKYKLSILILSVIFLASCKKNLEDTYNKSNPTQGAKAKKTSELVVAESFNWNTSKVTQIKLMSNDNYPAVIYALDGSIIAKSMVMAGQENLIPITTFAAQKQAKLVFMGKEYLIDLNSENVNIQLF